MSMVELRTVAGYSYTEFWFHCICWNDANLIHNSTCKYCISLYTISSLYRLTTQWKSSSLPPSRGRESAWKTAVMDFLVKISGSHVYARLQRSYEDACMTAKQCQTSGKMF
jgi:hypothetical protein